MPLRSLLALSAGLIGALVAFGIHADYSVAMRTGIAVVLLALIGTGGGWLLRAAWRTEKEAARTAALAGALLTGPFVLSSLAAGVGAPWQATSAQNELRYHVLLFAGITIGCGLLLLREVLANAGERRNAALGFACAVLASAAYLVWASLAIEFVRTSAAHPGERPPWLVFAADFSEVLLFVGSALTYAAGAVYVHGLRRAGWMRAGPARAALAWSLFALVALACRGVQFPAHGEATAHWSTIPGFVVGIPAVPWMMPCVLGVGLLRRAAAM